MTTALITGASRGLGKSLAEALRAAGWRVLATSRDGSTGVQLDVTSRSTIAMLAHEIQEAGTPIDVLVNNAAIYDGDRARVFETNFFGALHVTGALLPLVRDGGRVVMVSSGMGELRGAGPQMRAALSDPSLERARLLALVTEHLEGRAQGWPENPYSASKLALNALTRVLARELAPRAIRVNAVCPGWVRTDMGGPNAPRSIEQGTASLRAAVCADDDVTGAFFRDGARIAW